MKTCHKYLLLLLLIGACTPKVEEIHFGEENCQYCSMTIMDTKFATELVTQKGKVYKYDSVECLIHHKKKLQIEPAYIIVMNYKYPGEWINADEAIFIISDEIHSPMNGKVAAVANEQEALELNLSGSLFDWGSIQQHFQTL